MILTSTSRQTRFPQRCMRDSRSCSACKKVLTETPTHHKILYQRSRVAHLWVCDAQGPNPKQPSREKVPGGYYADEEKGRKENREKEGQEVG
jgi:hypothetical protein